MRFLDRPWTIVALLVLYLAPPALFIIDTAVHPGRPPLGWASAVPVAFCAFSVAVAFGLWFRRRPARIAALVFEIAALLAVGVGFQAFLLTFLFWLVVFLAVVIGGYSGAVVWLLRAPPTKRWFAEQAGPS